VDFYCVAANLVIECDGSQYFIVEGIEADQVRDQALVELGLITLRFSNNQILIEIDAVGDHVYCVVWQRVESPFLVLNFKAAL